MQILSLVNPEQSQIKYKLNNYPDGQQDIILLSASTYNVDTYWEKVSIESRFNSFNDLGLIIAATKALRSIGTKEIHLYIPYLLGARSDRKFVDGGCSYLRDVVAPIINAQNYASVCVMDAHSDVAEAVINNLIKVDNTKLVDFALDFIWTGESEEHDDYANKTVLVSPDAGALKKIYNVAEAFTLENIIVASKHRDVSTGKITHTSVPGIHTSFRDKDFIIIDDICDGGRTFIEIAKAIQKVINGANIHLIVTHGIFSAGYRELAKYFEGIYTTNSVFDFNDRAYGPGQINPNVFIKQLNIF